MQLQCQSKVLAGTEPILDLQGYECRASILLPCFSKKHSKESTSPTELVKTVRALIRLVQ